MFQGCRCESVIPFCKITTKIPLNIKNMQNSKSFSINWTFHCFLIFFLVFCKPLISWGTGVNWSVHHGLSLLNGEKLVSVFRLQSFLNPRNHRLNTRQISQERFCPSFTLQGTLDVISKWFSTLYLKLIISNCLFCCCCKSCFFLRQNNDNIYLIVYPIKG